MNSAIPKVGFVSLGCPKCSINILILFTGKNNKAKKYKSFLALLLGLDCAISWLTSWFFLPLPEQS